MVYISNHFYTCVCHVSLVYIIVHQKWYRKIGLSVIVVIIIILLLKYLNSLIKKFITKCNNYSLRQNMQHK